MSAGGGITLVCMPFGHVFSPSIGLSLLKAELAEQGLGSRVLYFSIRFAEIIGQHFYFGLSAQSRPSVDDLAGEWIFTRALFGPRARDEAYVDDVLRRGTTWMGNAEDPPASPALIAGILRARERADQFLDGCLEEVLRDRPRLVGFTSMFQQHVASLALARRIKERAPETFIVFGGANCEDVMGAETVRQFAFVDACVSGEADIVFPELARRVLGGRPVAGLPGVRTRDGIADEFARGRFSPGPVVPDLDALPYPDYGDYFEQFRSSRFGGEWIPSIYFETSRGCWWGQRMHCTFCGLNDETMAFRSKSSRRAIDELVHLTSSHPDSSVDATDNILDMRYFADFVPELARRRLGASLFYEVKANLKKEQVRLLAAAGIRRIQPGIESFSDPVLKLMRKGVSGLQNIQLLKWCKELGIRPGWNFLWGFPGEPPEEYDRMAALAPFLAHLPPPESEGMIRLDRFSPNFHEAERLGFTDVQPLPPYAYVYPLPAEALGNLAYFFTFRYREPRDVTAYVARLATRVRGWRRRADRHDLFSVDLDATLLVWDTRPGSALLTVLAGPERLLYRACDAACDLRGLTQALEGCPGGPFSPEAVERKLEPLLRRGLLVRDGSRYLALAIPLGAYSPPAPARALFYEQVRMCGRRVPEGWVVSPPGLGPGARNSVPSVRATLRRRAGRRPPPRLVPSTFSIDPQGDVLIRRRVAG